MDRNLLPIEEGKIIKFSIGHVFWLDIFYSIYYL